MTPLLHWLVRATEIPAEFVERICRLADQTDSVVSEWPVGTSAAALDTAWPRLLALAPAEPAADGLRRIISALRPEQLVPNLASRGEGLSVKAGLYLMHDYLSSAHDLAQFGEKHGSYHNAPYWHAIMHRREPDYDNARYWFRRVGSHAISAAVGRAIAAIEVPPECRADVRLPIDRQERFAPFRFVDWCEALGDIESRRSPAEANAVVRIAQLIQSIEIRSLFEHTYAAAAIQT